jgi:hypothetical protein
MIVLISLSVMFMETDALYIDSGEASLLRKGARGNWRLRGAVRSFM